MREQSVVLGEPSSELADELLAMARRPRDGAARVGPREDGPLVRALHRAEAELLLADADAMAAGTYARRTSEQRRADAQLLFIRRMREELAVAEGGLRAELARRHP